MSPLKIGNNEPNKLYLGADEIERLYLGDQQIWEKVVEETNDGPLSINVGPRSNRRCAPDSVRFTANLDGAGFDTQARWVHPGGALGNNPGNPGDVAHPAYDARLHDLLFFWDLGENRTWDKPSNVLSHWREARYQTGPVIAHMYHTPGTYTVRLTVVEPSSGKVATATTSITVTDPDDEYPTTQTYCINPDGDTDFSDAPAGANQIYATDFYTTWQNAPENQPLRWLFKRGGRYEMPQTIRIWPNRDGFNGAPDFYMGAYGSGADPIISDTSYHTLQPTNYGTSGSNEDIRVVNLYFDGNFDPATGDWLTDALFKADGSPSGVAEKFLSMGNGDEELHIAIANCTIRGYYGTWMNMQDVPNAKNHIHLDDCRCTDSRGGAYTILLGSRNHPESMWAVTGCDMAYTDLTPADNDMNESVIRQSGHQYLYYASNDFFTPANTNALMKIENSPESNTLIDFTNEATVEASGSWQHGHVFNVVNNTFEGQAGCMTLNRTAKSGGGVQNGIIERNIFIASPSTGEMIELGGQGITIRNNYFWVPPVQNRGGGLLRFIECSRFTYGNEATRYYVTKNLESTGQPYTWTTRPFPGMAPVRIYNNTFVCERSLEQNGRIPSEIVVNIIGLDDPNVNGAENYTEFEAVMAENNIFHAPNMGVTVPGLDNSTHLPFRPHFKGPTFWDNSSKTLTPPQPGNEFATNTTDIPTFAATSSGPTGTAAPGVTSHLLPLGVDWSYNNPNGSIEPPTKVAGAWKRSNNTPAPTPSLPSEIVIMGASLIHGSFGNAYDDTAGTWGSAHGGATTALQSAAGLDDPIPVYGYGRPGARLGYRSEFDIPNAVDRIDIIRAQFPNALIVCHIGGGDVSRFRPLAEMYNSEKQEWESSLDALIAKAAADGNVHIGTLTWRDYLEPDSGSCFTNPDLGSRPFNEANEADFKGIITKLAAEPDLSHTLTSYGRPYFDYYRWMLTNWETWLARPETDGTHPNNAGDAAMRDYTIQMLAHILNNTEPTETTERIG